MRFERLVLESGSSAVTLPFHAELTVIAGLQAEEREGLLGELLGGLAGFRRDSQVDVVDDAGRRLSVRRGETPGSDSIIDADSAEPVDDEFRHLGRLDLLHPLGLDLDRARRRCRLTPAGLAVVSRSEGLVTLLAGRDQAVLWAAAERLQVAEARLAEEAAAAGTTADDLPALEEIERRHAAFGAAQARDEAVRHHGIFIATACALAAIPAATLNRWTALPFLLAAVVTIIVAVVFRRRMEDARESENAALVAAGATSYVGFHIERLHRRLDGHGDRQGLAAAAAERRRATTDWEAIAGPVSAEWALSLRGRIDVAARAAQAPGGERQHESGAETASPPTPAELAEAFMVRLADLRHVGPDGQSLPLIADEPLAGVDRSDKLWMLELIGRSAGSPQVVYLTADPDVAAWARAEAQAGHLDLVEPTPVAEPPSSGNGRPATPAARNEAGRGKGREGVGSTSPGSGRREAATPVVPAQTR